MIVFPQTAPAAVDVNALVFGSASTQTPTRIDDLSGGGAQSLFPASHQYDLHYQGGRLPIERLITASGVYDAGSIGDIAIRRSAGPDTDILWQRGSASTDQRGVFLDAPRPAGLADVLDGNNLLTGADNVFANRGDAAGNNTNIERLDFIFRDGIVVGALRGFGIFDRGMAGDHDGFQIAAILSLDSDGVPGALGASTRFERGTWGLTPLVNDADYAVLRKDGTSADAPYRISNAVHQTIGGVLIPTSDLARSGERIFGFSLFALDVDASSGTHDWTDGAIYPQFTVNDNIAPSGASYASPGGGLDPVGVSAILFEQTVPEPSSVAGLLMFGLHLLRRHKTPA